VSNKFQTPLKRQTDKKTNEYFYCVRLSFVSVFLSLRWSMNETNDINHFTGARESRERNGWKGEYSDDCRKLAGTVQTSCGSSFQTWAAGFPFHHLDNNTILRHWKIWEGKVEKTSLQMIITTEH